MEYAKNWRFHLFVTALTLFYGLAFTFSEFYGSPASGVKDFFILLAQWGVVVAATYGLMLLLALNRWVFALLFTPMTLCCAILTYFRYTANITLTPMIIELCLVNDVQTGLTLVDLSLIVVMLAALGISIVSIIIRFRYITTPSLWPNLLGGLFVVALFNLFVPKLARPVSGRMPYSLYYNVKRYLSERAAISEKRTTFADQPVCASDSMTVVLVIGESLRADHLQINGYGRETTPHLMQDSLVVSFPHIYTEECFTHTSIPLMLTRADSVHPERAYTEPSFISLFKQAGYRTAWLANQGAVESYAYFMNECDTLVYANRGKSLYVFDKWLDGDLLPLYDEELERNEPRQLILLHTIGSHWWYESHYTDEFRRYTPVIRSKVVSSCTDEELVNSYDNTILYSDSIWASLIDRLRDRMAVLIYLSDHGESLGEDGLYLHGVEHPTLRYPACFVWTSECYARKYPERVAALRENCARHYRTDFLFHSILSGADIRSGYIAGDLDIFSSLTDSLP